MNAGLAPGLTHRFTYTVPPARTVPELLPESPHFQVLPPVLATGYLVALVEWACIDMIAEHLDSGQQTLGIHVGLTHEAPTQPGDTVTIDVELTAVDAQRLTFQVSATDENAVICRGTHDRAVIDRARFDARLRGEITG